MKKKDKYFKHLAFIAFFIYLFLLVPALIVHDAENLGIITEQKLVPFNDLPNDIQDILSPQNNYYVVVVKDLYSENQFAVIAADLNYNEGDVVWVDDITNEWYSDPHIFYSLVNQSFNSIIIGTIDGFYFGGWLVEYIINSGIGILLSISYIDFLLGGIILVLMLSFLLHDSVAMWNIPAILACYSFQYFFLNVFNTLNNIEISMLSISFGFLFILLIPAALRLKRLESTKKGRQEIIKIFKSQKQLFSSIKISLLKRNMNQ